MCLGQRYVSWQWTEGSYSGSNAVAIPTRRSFFSEATTTADGKFPFSFPSQFLRSHDPPFPRFAALTVPYWQYREIVNRHGPSSCDLIEQFERSAGETTQGVAACRQVGGRPTTSTSTLVWNITRNGPARCRPNHRSQVRAGVCRSAPCACACRSWGYGSSRRFRASVLAEKTRLPRRIEQVGLCFWPTPWPSNVTL